jgi:protein transport protein SEC13
VRVFDVNGNVYNQTAVLTGHDGPVWEVAWAHPKYGVLLASCSYDGQVIIHRETSANVWQKVFVHKIAEASVNAISWAPAEYGLILACASSDGKVTFLEHTDNDVWRSDETITVDSLGCNSVTWAPYSAIFSLDDEGRSVRRLATGSCNNHVTFWKKNTVTHAWEQEAVDGQPHTDWVRDVAWAPATGLPYNLLASCSEDCTVRIWTQGQDQRWTSKLMHE